MRVLVLAAATYADPATRKVFDHVASQGVEVILAMPRKVVGLLGPCDVAETPWPTPGVRLERLSTWRAHENGTHVIMRGLPRLIRDTQPDIIHCVLEPWSLICLQVLGIPSRARRRAKFGVQPCETKLEQGGMAARNMRGFLSRRVLSRCDFFVGWSTRVVKAALRYGLDGQSATTAPGVGVDTDLFRPAEGEEKRNLRRSMGLNPEDFVVGYAGRFVEEKGVSDLLVAMQAAVEMHPRLVCVLVGAGPLQAKLLEATGPRSWLHVIPAREQRELANVLRAFDLLALPSRSTPGWEEQFGLVLPEAMACGVPAVASTCGAIPEVVGDAGWIFPEGDTRALSSCLIAAMRDPSRVREVSMAARRRAEASFSANAVSRRLMEVWGTVCEGVRP